MEKLDPDGLIEASDDAVKELSCALMRLKSVRKRCSIRPADREDYVISVNTVIRALEILDPFEIHREKP